MHGCIKVGLTTVYLIRHAAHADLGTRLTGRADGAPLSDVGVAQAAALGERLRSEPIAAIYASPRERTQQTASAISRDVHTAPELDEIDFGDWTGKSFDELNGDPEWRQWNERRASARPPGGESMTEATGRAVAHIERTAAPCATVAHVTHCDIIRGVLAHYLGLSFDYMLRFDIDPASVSTLALGQGWARVTRLNA